MRSGRAASTSAGAIRPGPTSPDGICPESAGVARDGGNDTPADAVIARRHTVPRVHAATLILDSDIVYSSPIEEHAKSCSFGYLQSIETKFWRRQPAWVYREPATLLGSGDPGRTVASSTTHANARCLVNQRIPLAKSSGRAEAGRLAAERR